MAQIMDAILKTFSLEFIDLPMILVGAILFYTFWKAATKLFFNDFISLFEARDAATTGAEQTAVDMLETAQRINNELDSQVFEARMLALEKKNQIVAKAKAQANNIIEEAEGKAQETLRSVKWGLMQNIDQLRAETLKEAESLSDLVVEKIITQTTASRN